jgi:hypothetical protein
LIARLPRLLAILTAAFLLLAYALTLQTRINGSSDEYMIDVGEIQVALNTWGTIHHTGYPLFAILGNLFTPPLRLLGLEPAAAASLYATAWGLLALIAFGLLVWRITGRAALAVLSAVVLGLARSIWIHNVVAEVYSMSQAITVLMLLVALWPVPWRGRWDLAHRMAVLALLGGIGVSHHRALAFVAPGLLLAVGPHLWEARRRWPKLVPLWIGLALLGFVPYLYLPLREWQGGAWVYGEPGTWQGFWTEFSGREADRLVTLPGSAAGWLDNVQSTLGILAAELTLPGLLIGVAGLALALTLAPHWRAAGVFALAALGPLLFSVSYHTAVLPEAVLMPVVTALVFGVALAVDALAQRWPRAGWAALAGLIAWAAVLFAAHYDTIRTLITDPTGLHTIERAARIPRDEPAAFMLPWGPRYAAAAYSSLVTGENADVQMVDHKGDYRALLAEGYRLYTEPETFYIFPVEWWRERLGTLHLTSAAPGIVALQTAPQQADAADPPAEPIRYGIARREAWLTCDAEHIYLHVVWQAEQRPAENPSIFVHLTGSEATPVLTDDDSRYPVYGFYPFTEWTRGEIVRDDFTLSRMPGGTHVRFGLYEQDANEQFVNYGEHVLPVAACQAMDD